MRNPGGNFYEGDRTLASLWDVDVKNPDPGFLNLRAASAIAERNIVKNLDAMWALFEPYADTDFRTEFARQPDTRFWEMYLACRLLSAGRTLLPAADRKRTGGQPDICILDGGRRIWIEAIAPSIGQEGPDQVVGPKAIDGQVAVGAMPVRQAQLRISSALLAKSKKLDTYLRDGSIAEDDVRLIAVGACQFHIYALDEPTPTALSSVLPI